MSESTPSKSQGTSSPQQPSLAQEATNQLQELAQIAIADPAAKTELEHITSMLTNAISRAKNRQETAAKESLMKAAAAAPPEKIREAQKALQQ
ncbi:MAG: hypothetical protein F6J87_06075 [Spirulina sp. SIO3F2]|nr:hypothetical protein [Spirulina sp. SIO3F2]